MSNFVISTLWLTLTWWFLTLWHNSVVFDCATLNLMTLTLWLLIPTLWLLCDLTFVISTVWSELCDSEPLWPPNFVISNFARSLYTTRCDKPPNWMSLWFLLHNCCSPYPCVSNFVSPNFWFYLLVSTPTLWFPISDIYSNSVNTRINEGLNIVTLAQHLQNPLSHFRTVWIGLIIVAASADMIDFEAFNRVVRCFGLPPSDSFLIILQR